MAAEGVMELTEETFDAEVNGSPVPVLVDFYADWCIDCRMIAPALEEIAAEYAGWLKVAKVDTEAQTALAEKFGIGAIPAVFLFRGGREVGKLVGRQQKTDLIDLLTEALDLPADG